MVNDLGAEGGTPRPDNSPTGLTGIRTIVSGGDPGNETKQQPTTDEVIHGFLEREHRIRVFKESRILFDPKQLPGITPEESLDFLIKGLIIEGAEADYLRGTLVPNSEMGQNVRENFPEFIEYMTQQNKSGTITEIWKAPDADPFTKMAIQWEIQDLAERYIGSAASIEERAIPVAADLRRSDALLRKLGGKEIFLQCEKPLDACFFNALIKADGKGLDFIQDPKDPGNPYRQVTLSGQAASSKDWVSEHIETASYLIIPPGLRDILRSRTPERWGGDLYTFWREGKYGLPFDPDNPFPGIITGEELTEQIKDDGGLRSHYNKFKEAIEISSFANGIVPKP